MRRRLLLALTLVVGVLMFPASASATHDLLDYQSAVDAMLAVDPALDPPPNDPAKDFTVGGYQSFGTNHGVSAHSDGPSAEDAWGHISVTHPELGKTRSRVVCLAVQGSKAAIGFVPQDSAASPIELSDVIVYRDSGLPGGMGDVFRITGAFPETCQTVLLVTEPTFPIERGNILVHDAQP
jgi:hypothetical protein